MKLHTLALALVCVSTSAMAHENGTIKIYDAILVPQIVNMFIPGKLVMEDGQKKLPLIPKTARILNTNLEIVRDFYFEEFGRRSWDDKGSDILASINMNRFTFYDILGIKQNAAWTETHFVFGAGSKKGLDKFEKALDVIGHEYTHAVVQTTSNLKYEGESGALNEHLADVFGIIVNNRQNKNLSNPYLIGSTVLYGEYAKKAYALRDMMDPSRGLIPQPGHMDQVTLGPYSKFGKECVPDSANDHCGVHILSGIPNKAAALIISALGFEASAPLFYNVMTKRLRSDSQFADYRVALMEECKSLSSDACGIVDDALKSVGI